MFHHSHVQTFARVRCVHNVAKGPKVNVVVNGKIALSDVPYKAVSSYLRIPSGLEAISITTVDGSKTLASIHVRLVAGRDYTIIAHGDISNLSSIALLALEDKNSCPTKGKARVRFIHAAATVPNVDIWANNEIKVFSNVAYGSTGHPTYASVMATALNLSVTPAGSRDLVLGPLSVNLIAGKTYTIIASGLLGDSQAPISAIISEDSSCYTYHF